jgi:hypothetical protein
MSKITPLATGQITPTDSVTIVLAEPADMPAPIVIHWPTKPTVCDPRRYPTVAAETMRLLAEASTTLAAIKARRRL